MASAARTGNALLVRVKANQPSWHAAVVRWCAEQAPLDQHATVDRRRHGREEHRRVERFAVAGRLPPAWQGLIACAARITRPSGCQDTRSGLGQARRETAYHVSQIELKAEAFGRAVRAPWGIENRAHHVRDRILGEDASRSRRQPGIVARIRSFALNVLRAHGVANVSEAIDTNALSLDRLLACGLPKAQN